ITSIPTAGCSACCAARPQNGATAFCSTSSRTRRPLSVDVKGKITKRGCTAIRRSIIQGANVVMMQPPVCDITKYAYRRRKECPFNGKVAVAVANRMLRTGLALLHHDDLYRPMIENGFDRLKRKLAEYKLQALVPYLTRT
ncbi:MAG: hypothetical protein IKX15_01825, partial [Spirochaetales bacterium]|nr:hypothetical protein [Spirochaetales bacterium]